ncbi:hypothetical protein SLS58_008729 [Diplodia intermedia]|uniref:Minor tail protein n=1 Tax=Diplodia intermedia TaxID=856260 RepID=A0ABR3TGV4_9PEZI
MTFDRTGSEAFEFEPKKLGSVKPTLTEPEGIELTSDELEQIFGIQEHRFGKLPKRMIIPNLKGNWYMEQWYSTTGWLYVVEPEAWVPQVSFGDTMPVSEFKTDYEKTEESESSTKFNAGTKAEVSLEAGGTFYGVTASVKSTSKVGFKYSSKSVTKESLTTKGTSGNVPIHQLFVYPKLRCKVIKKQWIDYTINDSSSELKWTGESYNDGYWDARWVADKRLNQMRQLTLHPVPMEGNGLGHKAYMFPIPQVTDDGSDIDVTTILSRTGWVDWYHYDLPWKDGNGEVIDLAAPDNGVAFKPMATWTTLPSIKKP